MRWFKCKHCGNLYDRANRVIECCVLRDIDSGFYNKKPWTTRFKIGDIVRVEGLFFYDSPGSEDAHNIAGITVQNDYETYSYYYVVVGIGQNKIIVYNNVSRNLRVCGGYIGEKHLHLVKNVTNHMRMMLPTKIFMDLKSKGSQLTTLSYAEICKFELMADNPTMAFKL